METETPEPNSDWDYPLTDDELQAIDAAFSAAISDSPIKKCRRFSCPDAALASFDSPATTRRRLPQTLFTFQQRRKNSSSLSCSTFSTNRSYVDASYSYREIMFGGRIVYSRTIEEVERAAEELLKFMDINKRKGDQCVLGLDIEWRPSFKRGVAPGKVAVMQICVDNDLCHVLHVIHSGIPKSLQYLLEDPSVLKVGVCIANDAAKVLQDYNLSITSLRDLSDLANQKLGGDPKKWSLSMLTDYLICRQLPKPSKIRLGNWEVEVLSKEQLNYAATDAYVSWYLYQPVAHPRFLRGIPSESMGGISDNVRGLALALSSSIFIGSSFIIKKKGLKKAGASGTRASKGGYSYLLEPWWWAGMLTMLVGEGANFAAYAYAPATLVTPLGALSIIFSAVLAHFILDESLHMFGVVGCVLCLVGSVTIVLHAPLEKDFESVIQVWYLATEPGFIIYTFIVLVLVVILIFWGVPHYGQTHMVVYIGICSLMGSLTVMGVKAVGLALKLSFSGSNQFIYFVTWFFTILVIVFCIMQLIYLNKALDTFNTAVVSPVYYVMFTTLTIVASIIMFKEWDSQNASQIMTELCGFVTILCGTLLLHKTKDMGGSPNISSPGFHPSNREQGA